jgi:dolichol-phosphate mannosyltransferase
MGRVCLILPHASAAVLSDGFVARCRSGLEGAGHSVQVFAVADPEGPRDAEPSDGAWSWLEAPRRGLSAAAVAGLKRAEEQADYLIVLDANQGYDPEDLALLVEPLAQGTADLVVARRLDRPIGAPGLSARGRRLLAAAAGMLARPLLGASDLSAGLLAISAQAAREVAHGFDPVGSWFTADLLVRSKARRVEVPVRVEAPPPPVPLHLDDLRQLKRLADDRFGNASRLIQFCAVGASGMAVDLTFYAAFQLILSRTWLAGLTAPVIGGPLDLAVAGALAIAVALTWNFMLNRRLTFNYARHGSLVRQYLTYALSNALGIALSFSVRLYLPAHVGFFHRHKLAAAVVGIVAATGISFSMSRWLVFRRRSTPPHPHPGKDARSASPVVQASSAQ